MEYKFCRFRFPEQHSEIIGIGQGPDQLRQVFNDTDTEVLWLIIGAPEELEFLQGSKSTGMDLKLIYPTDPTQLPKELAGVVWPPNG